MAPKMDYDEWTPLGHGDPLKNDPTFDYSPPVVGKVKYWINPLFRTPDPPIIPNRGGTEIPAESNQLYTATTIAASKLISPTSPLTANTVSPSDIKRFYIDFKDDTASDMTFVQLLNSKYNNKLIRPQAAPTNHQNHHYIPTRQPPPPLPMLVPPPPVEPSSYSSTKHENSTALELSWNKPGKETATNTSKSLDPVVSFIANAGAHFTTSTASSTIEVLPHTTTLSPFASFTPKATTVRIKYDNKPDAFRIPSTNTILSTSDKSLLKNLLGKERLETNHPNVPPTSTLSPLTPNPATTFFSKHNQRATKSPTYLIIQGHSKVKKYGGIRKLDRAEAATLQDTNEINDVVRYELPRDARESRQLNVDDFLPFKGMLKDFVSSQAEGSGLAAELTKAVFPSYVRPSTTIRYDQPRSYEYDSVDHYDEYSR